LRKLVRLVGRCHRGERLEMESSGRNVQFGVVCTIQTLLCEVD
jgi:hypothetical protein